MYEVAITAIGADRPGVVAGFTEVLLAQGCNLADCSMSLLGNQFAMILLVEAPDSVALETLKDALQGPARQLDLLVETRVVVASAGTAPSTPLVISAYGHDRPGIVHAVASALAEVGVNITDLRSHLAGEDLYAMVLDVEVPPGGDPEALAHRLQAVAADLGVTLTMRTTDAANL